MKDQINLTKIQHDDYVQWRNNDITIMYMEEIKKMLEECTSELMTGVLIDIANPSITAHNIAKNQAMRDILDAALNPIHLAEGDKHDER